MDWKRTLLKYGSESGFRQCFNRKKILRAAEQMFAYGVSEEQQTKYLSGIRLFPELEELISRERELTVRNA